MVDRDSIPIERLELSVRSLNSLKRGGVHTIAQLLLTGNEMLLSFRNFGHKGLIEVKSRLVERGYLEPSALLRPGAKSIMLV